MRSTPHDDLHPAARDHAQKKSCEESQGDWRVKHCRSRCETPVFRSRPRSGDVLGHHLPGVAALAVQDWSATSASMTASPEFAMTALSPGGKVRDTGGSAT